MSSLDILPKELLEIIFNLCDVYTVLQLRRVCKKFDIISSYVLNKKSNRLLVTNQMSEKFRERCKSLLSSYNSKFITHYNWKCGIAHRDTIYNAGSRETTRDMRINKKCLKMTKNTILFYDNDVLSVCNRAKNGNITENIMRRTCSCQFSSFAYCNDIIISGHVDGSIRHWKIESRNNINNLQQLKAHSNVYGEYVSNIEVTTQHIISSSSNLIKIQKNTFEDDDSAEENEPIYKSKKLIQSISLHPTKTKVAASTEESFLIYDINANVNLKRAEVAHCGKEKTILDENFCLLFFLVFNIAHHNGSICEKVKQIIYYYIPLAANYILILMGKAHSSILYSSMTREEFGLLSLVF
ncbi:uncharacterized protein [Linepithema humile]|uniref:uncharacterized protein isoform X3 n=1 Tax=Linepithema humile TaxID=83485 RepID=UPI00351F092D